MEKSMESLRTGQNGFRSWLECVIGSFCILNFSNAVNKSVTDCERWSWFWSDCIRRTARVCSGAYTFFNVCNSITRCVKFSKERASMDRLQFYVSFGKSQFSFFLLFQNSTYFDEQLANNRRKSWISIESDESMHLDHFPVLVFLLPCFFHFFATKLMWKINHLSMK
jgi:hypothetical protein